MSIVGSIISGVMGANAAGAAANSEVTGAQNAQALEKQNQTNAQNFQTGVWSGTQQAEQPYQQLGSTSANGLRNLLSTGFTAPTLADAQNSPGYQFELETGANAIDENAAATGTLNSGNTGVALEKFGTGLADQTYGDVYNRALQTYMSNYQSLLGGTNIGLSSTAQQGQLGQEASSTMAGIDLTGGQQQAQQINNAAVARASGYLNQANAYSNMIGGITGGMQGGFGNLDSTGGSTGMEQLGNFAMGALAV